MTFLKLETSARFNRKLIKAGPPAAWLWLCGNLYCQEALTDGFISAEALEFLGVKGARKFVGALVTAGLWVESDGGWQVHDYLEHNRSADEVARLKQIRRENGKKGGRPTETKTKPNANQDGYACETEPVSVSVSASGYGSGSASVSDAETPFTSPPKAPNHPFPRWLTEWHAAYPKSRQVDKRKIEREFVSAFFRHEDAPPLLFGRMMTALEAHKASEEWQRGVVPGMSKWLNEDWWLRELPPVKAVTGRGDRTAGNVAALQSFLDRKRAANDQ